MINENKLVQHLEKLGFEECFTELLSTVEKVLLFEQAEWIVGAIGGGVANVLFSKNCKLTVVVSPYFLEVNDRFRFSLEHVDCVYCLDCWKVGGVDGYYKWMRAEIIDSKSKWKGWIGEISGFEEQSILVNLSKKGVVGWNSESNFITIPFQKEQLLILDKGLNSEYECNLKTLLTQMQNQSK